MDKHVIQHKVLKEADGSYYTIAFPVPYENLERITVSYSYKRISGKADGLSDMVNVIDLGLMDGSGRFLGWSGSARRSVFVGPYASTRGYLMTDITPGEWQIIVGVYKVPAGGLTVSYEIEYAAKQSRWLTGDLHVHSDASDGQHDIPTLAKKAIKAGLDFIAVANHNNYSENLNLPVVPGLTLLPAVEWTHYRGHMNFFGIAEPFENSFIANDEEQMLALVANARARGALISVNHPKCNICPYLWRSWDCFDMVEVWNGPMRGVNLSGIAWWHDMLMSGRRIPLTGGSDYHRDIHPVLFAHPAVRVYSRSPAARDILDALAKGHSYVTTRAGGVTMELNCDDAIMGDGVAYRDGLELSIRADKLRPGVRLKLVTSEGIAARWKRSAGGSISAKVLVEKTWRFAYLAAERNLFGWRYVRAISNPIYFD